MKSSTNTEWIEVQDFMFALRMVVEKIWKFNRKTQIGFINQRKAFDSVPRAKMWRVLREEYGVRKGLVNALKSM